MIPQISSGNSLIGFKMNVVDDCVSKCIFLVLYVNDILLATNNIDMFHKKGDFYQEISK